MKTQLQQTNRGVWCGTVVGEPVLDHVLRHPETHETIRTYYRVKLRTDHKHDSGLMRNTSFLPVLISDKKLLSLPRSLSDGDILFVKGEWRAYRNKDNENKKKTKQSIHAHKVEILERFTRTKNKIQLAGKLVSKLYKAQYNGHGDMITAGGKPVPVLDRRGKRIPWVRWSRDGKTVNDVHVEVVGYQRGSSNTKYQDFTPCIGVGDTAWKIARTIEVGDSVELIGYVQSRVTPSNEEVYEVVITEISSL